MLSSLIPKVWSELLQEFNSQIDQIGTILRERADSGERILPDRGHVFRALELAPADVKVIIIGQDPYPNPKDACGLAFSVPPRASGLPGSLMNIQKEIITDIGSTTTADGDLTRWSKQGVMLLNRTLTVTAGESGSHAGLGWHEVTGKIAEICASQGAVAVLWGNHAKELSPLFGETQKIEGVHPSPLSAHRGFLGSKPFSQVNTLLRERGIAPVIW